jgi:Cys-rich four helix bundle protein (predicted Tat secretion target)
MMQSTLGARKDHGEHSTALTRRLFLLSASGGLLTALAPTLARAEESAVKPVAHGQHRDLIEAALNCVGWGEQCQKHILGLFTSGDTSLTQCSARIRDMIVLCNAAAGLAAAESEYLKPLAKVCIDACESCEKECRKHEQHHPICKETADACARTALACKKIVA